MNTICGGAKRRRIVDIDYAKQNVSLSRHFSPWGILAWLLTICQIHHHIREMYRIHFDKSIRIFRGAEGGGRRQRRMNTISVRALKMYRHFTLSPFCIGTTKSILFFTHVHREIYACRMILRLFIFMYTWLLMLMLMLLLHDAKRVSVSDMRHA